MGYSQDFLGCRNQDGYLVVALLRCVYHLRRLASYFMLIFRISILYDSPLKRGDKGVCKFAVTHPQPLFLEGSLRAAAEVLF